DRSLHCAAYQTHLRENEKRKNSTVVQIREQLVQMQSEKLLARHGLKKPIQAVDEDHSRIVLLDRPSNFVNKLAGRYFCGVKVLNIDPAGTYERIEVH